MTIVELAAQVAAGLVLVAGVGKLLHPAVARDALGLRTPLASWAVRALGAGEITLALLVVALGGRLLFALLAGTYVAFTVVAARQRRIGGGCGCFGASASTVGGLHLGVDIAASGVAAGAAWLDTPALAALLPTGYLAAGATLGLLLVAILLARLVLTELVELLASRSGLLTETST